MYNMDLDVNVPIRNTRHRCIFYIYNLFAMISLRSFLKRNISLIPANLQATYTDISNEKHILSAV